MGHANNLGKVSRYGRELPLGTFDDDTDERSHGAAGSGLAIFGIAVLAIVLTFAWLA